MIITDEQLYKNAPFARDIWYETVKLKYSDDEHLFSFKFRKKMNVLIKESKKKNTTRIGALVRRTVAIIFIAITVSLAATMSVEAYREKVIEVVKYIFEECTNYIFSSGKDANEILDVFIEDIPDGYLLAYENKTMHSYNAYFINGNNNVLVSVVMENKNMSHAVTIDSENASVEEIVINGDEAIYYAKEETNTIVIVHGDVVVTLCGEISKEDIINFSKKIKY